jgi:hypothetical protein
MEVHVRIADGAGGYREAWIDAAALVPDIRPERRSDRHRAIALLRAWRDGDADEQRIAWEGLRATLDADEL